MIAKCAWLPDAVVEPGSLTAFARLIAPQAWTSLGTPVQKPRGQQGGM